MYHTPHAQNHASNPMANDIFKALSVTLSTQSPQSAIILTTIPYENTPHAQNHDSNPMVNDIFKALSVTLSSQAD